MKTILTFSLTLLSISMLTNGECVFQDDPENVVSTQLEGSWGLNQELTQVLVPSFADSIDLKEIK